MEHDNLRDPLETGLASLRATLKKNEKINKRIHKKQNEIHKRQFNVSLIFVFIFTLFIIIASIYANYIIQEFKEDELAKAKSAGKKENVLLTVSAISGMIRWSDSVAQKDVVYACFLKDDPAALEKYVSGKRSRKTKIPNEAQVESLMLSNPNIFKFYSYFEILKNYDKSNMLDHDTAFDLLSYFRDSGKHFDYIRKIRQREHRITKCDCGLIFDGYVHVFKYIFHEDIKIENFNDIPEN